VGFSFTGVGGAREGVRGI